MSEPTDLTPAERVEPDPTEGWRGADVTDDERVDDDFIAQDAARVYEPLMPEDDKLYPPPAAEPEEQG